MGSAMDPSKFFKVPYTGLFEILDIRGGIKIHVPLS